MDGFKFSQNLIDRITTYFHDKHGVFLDIEQAQEYLSSLGDLYGSFVEFVDYKKKTPEQP